MSFDTYDLSEKILRILRERLNDYEIDPKIIRAIKDEIVTYVMQPQKKVFGASVMTEGASMAADKIQKEGQDLPPQSARPTII